ncbi:MAG: tRNA (adenosine(37)-N6)-threonylcarbamoyltransferase complex dimerization subunit type 1 TsaB [Bacteroidota bacterium]
MSLILQIDTATDKASVSLAFKGKLLLERFNGQSMDHAAWIHTAIGELMHAENQKDNLNEINAVAVVGGPGSYTGLRVGMATAKGLCYALNIPLISLNTLTIMAHATKKEFSSSLLFCPMLDARRMEVFTALYDTSLNELIHPCAMILEENSFSDWLNKNEIVFFGSGSNKWKEIVKNENAIFKNIFYTPQDIATIAYERFTQRDFSGLAYTEPIYLKEFYSHQKK